MVIMSLVVLVPLISSVYPIEVLWLSGTVLVVPPVHLQNPKNINSWNSKNWQRRQENRETREKMGIKRREMRGN